MSFNVEGGFAALAIKSAAFDFSVTVMVGAISGSALFAFEF